jgi:hypothetical protein
MVYSRRRNSVIHNSKRAKQPPFNVDSLEISRCPTSCQKQANVQGQRKPIIRNVWTEVASLPKPCGHSSTSQATISTVCNAGTVLRCRTNTNCSWPLVDRPSNLITSHQSWQLAVNCFSVKFSVSKFHLFTIIQQKTARARNVCLPYCKVPITHRPMNMTRCVDMHAACSAQSAWVWSSCGASCRRGCGRGCGAGTGDQDSVYRMDNGAACRDVGHKYGGIGSVLRDQLHRARAIHKHLHAWNVPHTAFLSLISSKR